MLVSDGIPSGYLCEACPHYLSHQCPPRWLPPIASRINDFVRTVEKWQPATELKYVSSGKLDQGNLAPWYEDVRHCKEKIHRDAMALVGWSDAAYGGQPNLGKCRLGNVSAFMSSNRCGPGHIMRWATKFTGKLIKGSLGGEVYASSKMLGHMSTLHEFCGHFAHLRPGTVGLEGWGSLFTHLKKQKMIPEKFSVRRFLALQQAIEIQELGNVYWILGRGNPTDGLTALHREILPLPR